MPDGIDVLYCPRCARDCLTEQPPCAEGHDECPERVCVECGTALMLDDALLLDRAPSLDRASSLDRAPSLDRGMVELIAPDQRSRRAG